MSRPSANHRRNVSFWSGFRTPEVLGEPHADAAGVGKAPRHEIAVGWAPSGAAGAMGIWTRGRRACSLIVPNGRRAEGRLGLMGGKNEGPDAWLRRSWDSARVLLNVSRRCGSTVRDQDERNSWMARE